MEQGKSYHMHLSLRGALNWPKPQFKKLLKGITKADGSRFTSEELREAFYDDIAAGKEVVPVGECDNFDFKTGCLGHPVAESI
jgi:hypothetical protein